MMCGTVPNTLNKATSWTSGAALRPLAAWAIQSMKRKPRQYQTDAVEVICLALKKHRRALMAMATGLGKTFTAALAVKRLRPRRILFLVHNNFILEHAMKEFRAVLGERVNMVTYNGISKAGAEEAQIVFATWQTMRTNLRFWKKNHFGMIIVDEAHHTGAGTWKPVAKYFTGPRLGLTATPDRTDAEDIREIFGKEVVKFTLEEAIARGWLPRIEYHVMTSDLDASALAEITAEIKQSHRRFSVDEINRRLFIKKHDVEVAKIINGYDEKAIVFCQSIAHAERFVKNLDSAATFHSGKRDTESDRAASGGFKLNQEVLRDLDSGKLRRVCAVNAFNEGVDVPSVGLVSFCRVANSMMIFLQQLGRGLRPGKDKLIVLDFVGNLERIHFVMSMMNRIADLHEEFTSTVVREREGYSREQFEVSGTGFNIKFSDEVVNLLKVLDSTKLEERYETVEEVFEACKVINIRTYGQYCKRYKEDPKLPSPSTLGRYPNFPGSRNFFRGGLGIYETLAEAVAAIFSLNVKTLTEYRSRHKEDPRLPSHLSGTYPEYENWLTSVLDGKANSPYQFNRNRFQGGGPNFYGTCLEASVAARKWGFKTSSDYQSGYKKDPRLPAHPRTTYDDFPGWKIFLNGIPQSMLKFA